MPQRAAGLVLFLALVTAAGVWLSPSLPEGGERATPAPTTATPTSSPTRAAPPLAGVRIALDPGHQLGNRNFPAEVNARVSAGGFTKACNSTGTASDAGLPEATFVWEVANLVRAQLERLGATVLLTRDENSDRAWGPCIDERGAFGARVGAALAVSLHADGAPASASGFHVIVPEGVPGFTDDIAAPSRRLGQAMRAGLDSAGLSRSTYVAGGLHARADLGTLNLSDVPTVMLELGNMRNPDEARRMSSAAGQRAYADGVVAGIRTYLDR